MERRQILFVIFFQWTINNKVFTDEANSASSRSVHCMTKRNKRLQGFAIRCFESSSLLSCNHSCMRKEWCTSTNFKLSSKNGGKGTCELNKQGISLAEENAVFHEEQGVTFSMHLKVNTIFLS